MTFEDKLEFWATIKYGKLKNFAEVMEITQPVLSRYLAGKQRPGFDFFCKLRKLGCDMNWLFDPEQSFESSGISEPSIDYASLLEKERLKEELAEIRNKLEIIDNIINKKS